MNAKVLSNVGGVYRVLTKEGKLFNVKPRGLFRHQKIKPLVGDNVILDDELTIVKIKNRQNILLRPTIANLDLAIVVVSMKEPDFSYLLLDKFLAMLSYSHVKNLIILSKIDLVSEEEVKNIIIEYQKIGYQVLPFCKKDGSGLEAIKEAVKDKTVAFMGQTGVGKSSLINAINPHFNRDVGEFSTALGRGKHQTKEVIIFPYETGFIADTPGFSSLELSFFKEDLAQCFIPFNQYYEECFFRNCLHDSEHSCKVKEMVEKGEISKIHYQNYLSLLRDLPYRKDRYQK